MKILINSLPKSGTHLLAKYVDLLGKKSRRDIILSYSTLWFGINPLRNIYRLVVRHCFFMRKKRGVNVDIYSNKEKAMLSFIKKEISKASDGDYVLSHLPYSKKLADLFFKEDYKVIHIVRNPRDVALSFVNYSIKNDFWYADVLKKYKTTQEQIIAFLKGIKKRFFIAKGFYAFQFNAVANLRQGVENCSGWLQDERVCFVRFEDLIGPKGGGDSAIQDKTIIKILDYLEIEASEDVVKNIKDNIFDRKSNTFSKGQIDSWKEVFDESVEKVYKKEIAEKAKMFGYN